jgi:dTDP-4-dehydrorhamnose 3,5-epimerase-like enzyme
MPEPQKTNIDDVVYIYLKNYSEKGGKLVPVHTSDDFDFSIKRFFYVFDVPDNDTRGKHAHHRCDQILIAVSGTVDVLVRDGTREATHTLNRPNKALWIPPGIWAEETYCEDSVLLVLCSHRYARADYMNDWEEFKQWKAS